MGRGRLDTFALCRYPVRNTPRSMGAENGRIPPTDESLELL